MSSIDPQLQARIDEARAYVQHAIPGDYSGERIAAEALLREVDGPVAVSPPVESIRTAVAQAIAAERMLIGMLLADPALHRELPESIGDGVLIDMQAREVLSAIANLRSRGELGTRDEVRRELTARRGHRDHGWLDDIDDVPIHDSIAADRVRRIAELVVRTSAALREAGEHVEPADPWQAELAAALADVQTRLGTSATANLRPLFSTDAVDLLQQKFDGPRWLVTGLLTRLGTGIIGAEPKAAKTWLGTEIALAVATGTKVCGEFFAEAGTVAYFYAEDRDVQVRNRVRALLAGANRQLARGRLHLQPRGEFLDVLDDRHLARIVASCRRLGRLDLVVLDPLRDIHGGEEDKSDSMRNVMRRLRVLGELLDCGVLVVHHAPKITKDNAKRRPGVNLRGSSAIHGSIDSGLYLTDTGGDEVTTFSNVVTSQVKGARSAGRFTVTLNVQDDEHGEAIGATWAVSRDKATSQGQPKTSADDDAVFGFVRDLAMRGITLGRTALRQHDERPVAEKKTAAAIDRLLSCNRLALRSGRVLVTGSEACNGTD